jgi:hypothetical protein
MPAVPTQQIAPPLTPMMPLATPPVIMAPPSSGTGGMRKLIYVVLGLIILGGIAYSLVSLMTGSDTAPIASDTPSPSSEPTLTLGGKSLRSYVGADAETINITNASTAVDDFRNGIITSQPTAKLATVIAVSMAGSPLSAGTFLGYTTRSIPPSLVSVFGTDWALLSFGQTEVFDAAGVKSESQTVLPKIVVIVEVNDASGARQAMQTWETAGLASASEPLFGNDVTKKIVPGFTEGVYKTIPVRYWNFPYADSSVDYAIVTASNNKNYLILSASRESMFFAIDQLMR